MVTQLKLFFASSAFLNDEEGKLGYYLIDKSDNRGENRIIEIWDNRNLM